jgi:hypothetical protein
MDTDFEQKEMKEGRKAGIEQDGTEMTEEIVKEMCGSGSGGCYMVE